MAANEVNDVLVKLLAAAENLNGPIGQDLLVLVSRLSGAATRERNAAVDEMQRLRKKVIQQQAELKRLADAQRPAQVPQTAQVAQPAIPPQAPMVTGCGHFNSERLRAIQAATAVGPGGKDDCPGSLPYHPLMDQSPTKPPQKSVTAANTEPLAPRRKLFTTEQAHAHDNQVEDLVRSLLAATTSAHSSLKHKRSTSELPSEASKRPRIAPSATLPALLPSAAPTTSPTSKANGASCVGCLCKHVRCTGTAQCEGCRGAGEKCVYLLCEVKDCRDTNCKFIHRRQYAGEVREWGQPRRNVLGDTTNSASVATSVINQLTKAQMLLDSIGNAASPAGVFGALVAKAKATSVASRKSIRDGGLLVKSNDAGLEHERETSTATDGGAPLKTEEEDDHGESGLHGEAGVVATDGALVIKTDDHE